MPGWLQAVLIASALVVVSWLLLILLARRLPPGVAKDLAGFIPDCVTACRVLRKDPRVPRRAKVAVVVAMLWVLSPIDLIPEFLPVIGPLDDVIAVALLLRYAGRTVPRQVLLDAWPSDPLGHSLGALVVPLPAVDTPDSGPVPWLPLYDVAVDWRAGGSSA